MDIHRGNQARLRMYTTELDPLPVRMCISLLRTTPGRGPCVGNHLSQAAKHRAPASSGIPAASCRGPPSQGWPNSRKLRNLKKLEWQHQSGGRPRARTAAPCFPQSCQRYAPLCRSALVRNWLRNSEDHFDSLAFL